MKKKQKRDSEHRDRHLNVPLDLDDLVEAKAKAEGRTYTAQALRYMRAGIAAEGAKDD